MMTDVITDEEIRGQAVGAPREEQDEAVARDERIGRAGQGAGAQGGFGEVFRVSEETK
jgi:hypothetical protein